MNRNILFSFSIQMWSQISLSEKSRSCKVNVQIYCCPLICRMCTVRVTGLTLWLQVCSALSFCLQLVVRGATVTFGRAYRVRRTGKKSGTCTPVSRISWVTLWLLQTYSYWSIQPVAYIVVRVKRFCLSHRVFPSLFALRFSPSLLVN